METGRLTKADSLVFRKTPWCALVSGEGSKTATFWYKTSRLREEISKRTSFLGKMRGAEGQPHLLDRIALTADEEELFREYLRTAASDVYDMLAPFSTATMSIEHGDTVRMEELDAPQAELVLGSSTQHSGGNVTVYAGHYEEGYPYGDRTVRIYANIRYKTHYTVGGLSFEMEKTVSSSGLVQLIQTTDGPVGVMLAFTFTPDLEPAGAVTSAEVFDEVTGISLVGVDVKLKSPDSITAGTWVEYVPTSGETLLYKALADTDTNADITDRSLFEPQEADMRDCVVYTLPLPADFDDGALTAADTALRDALVYDIIHLWLLLSYPDEADKYANLYLGSMEKLRVRLQRRTNGMTRRIIPRAY